MFIVGVLLTALVAYFGFVPFMAGAAYRFKNKTMLLVEALGFFGAAAYGGLDALIWDFQGVWGYPVLILAALVGIGIRQLPNAQKRLE